MRAELKLHYKEGFKSSGSSSFELWVWNNTYWHTTPACQNSTRCRHDWKTCTLLFCSTAQAWNVRRAQLLHCFIFAGTTLFPAEANCAVFAAFFNGWRFFFECWRAGFFLSSQLSQQFWDNSKILSFDSRIYHWVMMKRATTTASEITQHNSNLV